MSVNQDTKKRPSAGQRESCAHQTKSRQESLGPAANHPRGAGLHATSPLCGFKIIVALEAARQMKEIKQSIPATVGMKLGLWCLSPSVVDQHVLGIRPSRPIQIFEF